MPRAVEGYPNRIDLWVSPELRAAITEMSTADGYFYSGTWIRSLLIEMAHARLGLAKDYLQGAMRDWPHDR